MKIFLKEFIPFGLVLFAILSAAICIPLGFIHLFFKPFYDVRKKGIIYAFGYWFVWMFRVLYQLWVAVKYLLFQIAYFIDLLGNVLFGEMLEDIVTTREDTYLGKGGITISAALGELAQSYDLNKTGIWLVNLLGKVDKNHCQKAIELWDIREKYK
jgi:hypothetical protein